MVNWKVEKLIVKPQDENYADVVISAAWRCFAQQDNEYASISGHAGFSRGNEFIPYSELAEKAVLEWIWASGIDRHAIEAEVAKRLADQLSPPAAQKDLPWANVA